MHSLTQSLRKVKFRWNKVSWQQRILREKKSDTCSLFAPFGDPWPSCFLPFHLFQEKTGRCEFLSVPSTFSPKWEERGRCGAQAAS